MQSLTEQKIQQRTDELLACFETIHRQSMTDVPLLNADLNIEAIGFRRWQTYALGILITPWMMKIMALPLLNKPLAAEAQHWVFPSGGYCFEYEKISGLGECYGCSLFSPMQMFADQAAARATAEAMMVDLFKDAVEQGMKASDAIAQKPLSRRQFLRGRAGA